MSQVSWSRGRPSPRCPVFFRSLRSTLVLLVAGLAIASPATASAQTRLQIPRLELDVVLARTLADGPKLYFRDRDTVAIAGHRTTHTRPFLYLPRLRRGDTIFLGAKKVRRAKRRNRAAMAGLGAALPWPRAVGMPPRGTFNVQVRHLRRTCALARRVDECGQPGQNKTNS